MLHYGDGLVLLIREKVVLNTKMGGCYFECGKLNFLSRTVGGAGSNPCIYPEPVSASLRRLVPCCPTRLKSYDELVFVTGWGDKRLRQWIIGARGG